jgi:vancomycin resistance protein YoaR
MTEQVEKKRRLTAAHKKAIGVTFFGFTLLGIMILLIISANIALAKTFDGRVYRNVIVAGIPIGGMSKERATQTLQEAYNHMIAGGLIVELYNETKTVDLSPSGATDPDLVYPLIDVDINTAVESAFAAGRTGETLADYFSPLWFSTFGQRFIIPTVTIAETKLADSIRSAFPDAESSGAPTDFVINSTKAPREITVSPAISGATLDLSAAFAKIARDARDFSISPVDLALTERSTIISQAEAETLIPAVEKALAGGPYTLTYTNEYKQRFTFPVTVEDLQTWLLPTKTNGRPALTLDTEAMKPLFDAVHAKLDISAHDAVFETEGTRVTKFEPSRKGLRLDDDALIESLTAAFSNNLKEVALSVMTTEPAITTSSSNTLGISEVLGVGTSNYGVSPSNRIKNIQNGIKKLNGILIAPGETLSLIENLQPFTVQEGYFPELVIKGDEIKPEVGGGLCQIGTTTFRAVMNSGLKVVERRNHSLAISHYNDPSNNNPGTDATIYDPSPDFKFENDTGNTIMFIAEVSTVTHELTFTFWGTSDGRKGSYVPPTVLSRSYPSKETKIIMTTNLAPGKQSCNASFPGASTTFDYNIENPDGTITTQTFTSTYRALQKVCLQGIDPNAPAIPDPLVQGMTDPTIIEPIPAE